MSKHHSLKTRKTGSSPQSLAARQRSAMTELQLKGLALPINFLLGHSDSDLANFELALLTKVAEKRAELHEILDVLIEANGQAAAIHWFRGQDRQSLKHAIENEETPEAWAARMIRDGQRSESELEAGKMPMPNIFRPALEPGAAHLAAALRYQERNIAEGKCRYCPKPLDRNSVDMCTEHLAMRRERMRQINHTRGKRANPNLEPGTREYLYGAEEVPLSTHGRQPGTLASLELNREKKTRAVLEELGIKPEHAAVSLKAAKEAILRCLPDLKHRAMKAYDLFQKAQVVTSAGKRSTTGYKALTQLLAEGKIQHVGEGSRGKPYRYFASGEAKPEETRKPKKLSRTKQNSALLKMMQGEETNEE